MKQVILLPFLITFFLLGTACFKPPPVLTIKAQAVKMVSSDPGEGFDMVRTIWCTRGKNFRSQATNRKFCIMDLKNTAASLNATMVQIILISRDLDCPNCISLKAYVYRKLYDSTNNSEQNIRPATLIKDEN